MEFIKNLKISAIFSSELPITHFYNLASDRNVSYITKRNILVIKDVLSITVFKKKQNQYHLNITGIKCINDLDKTLVWVTKTYCVKPDFRLISSNIDNITSSFDVKQNLSLHALASTINKSSYNPERFHALYFKHNKGTIVVFQSGKINIVGCKTVENILTLWRFIKQKIDVAPMKSTF